ncbi:tRNA preQ1(34) S-adenosylmethionine ribosyltransferase-isomerase QueA [Patescibacteria group bacterium]|nr:tRNA preQ1(34) S-adenosylmethionine ribosyltransferase-isomerase QueA [Patescibacteria group bacterium]MBU1702917.1 tRNA preQ1(34) S-adenosylmethionine ribosyltransferase-isomerase QueA [Patescibacteria group bacterium]MBU1953493.1 tRNA preQ1(34) S-adenosylmethionine ribosyltransferase-isomerase QueA [Patescibacteria group bacterium]
MFTEDFDFILPDNLIASEPKSPRDACRLMVIERSSGRIGHKYFYQLENILEKGDVLVFNDSKVIPARIILPYKERYVEIFLIKRVNETDWFAMVRPGKFFRPGFVLLVGEGLKVSVVSVLDDGQRIVRFSDGVELQEQVIRNVGKTPFPPYIKKTTASFEDYQTVFAKDEGSVAAPTAGLHFTKRLLEKLRKKGVLLEFVTLHIGLGTFMPIKAKKVMEHVMHYENYYLDDRTANRLSVAKKEGRRIIAVGTTSVRVLEDSYDKEKGFLAGQRETNLFIYPGYEWKAVDALITNFHLPKSSLLLLTCAFGGTELVMRSYKEAIELGYRFYSFGDAMIIV